MKRYDLARISAEAACDIMTVSTHGKWVKFADVRQAIAYYEAAKAFEHELMNGTGKEKPKGLINSFNKEERTCQILKQGN